MWKEFIPIFVTFTLAFILYWQMRPGLTDEDIDRMWAERNRRIVELAEKKSCTQNER